MLGTRVKTFTGTRTWVAWSTGLQRERQKKKKKDRGDKKIFIILHSLYQTLEAGSFKQSTHKPPGAVCVAVLAVSQHKRNTHWAASPPSC